MAKKLTELPKLPYGMGSMSWANKEKTMIVYRKNIGEGRYKKSRAVYGETVKEVTKKMDVAEKEYVN